MLLSLGALGVVFGDIGTSPLYAVQQVFVGGHALRPLAADVLGAISLMLWSLVLIVTVKYVLLLMRASNDGEGGIMAVVALVQRSVSPHRRGFLVVLGLLGASLFFGDGMITPAISVLSAVSGLEVASPRLAVHVVPISVAVLVALFLLQRIGTGGVGALFGPIMAVWFAAIGAAGAVEVAAHPGILRALSPLYGLRFLVGDPRGGFLSLGAIVLVVTGAEALYADMGHFGRPAIARAWLVVTFPALLLNYLGQGALILERPAAVGNPFFHLLPAWGQLPMVFLATVATVIASQAVISGAFSITRQAMQLGFLPRLTVHHTSTSLAGQVYVPFVNWLLLAAVIVLIVGFRSSDGLASAYGIAVTGTFATTTVLGFVVFRVLWRWPLRVVLPLASLFLVVELAFFAANLTKVTSGGWLPLLVGAAVFTLVATWRRGVALITRRMRAGRTTVRRLINRYIDEQPLRVPGAAVYLTAGDEHAPAALVANVEHHHVLHERVVLFTAENVGVPRVADIERLSVTPLRLGFVRVVARFGFQEHPDVVAALELARRRGLLDVDPDAASYFVSHLTLIPSSLPDGLPRWQRSLFMLMRRNAVPAARALRVPPERLFEIGVAVEI